jgi:hypothetical protein
VRTPMVPAAERLHPRSSSEHRACPFRATRRRVTGRRLWLLARKHEGVPLIVIERQPGHSNLGITSIYLQGIDNAEIIDAVHGRRAPMIPVSASLRL